MSLESSSSETIQFPCPKCNTPIRVPARYAGKQGKCKKCSSVVAIPIAPVASVSSPTTKQCPACGQQILVLAKKCKHCGEWLTLNEAVQELCSAETVKDGANAQNTHQPAARAVMQFVSCRVNTVIGVSRRLLKRAWAICTPRPEDSPETRQLKFIIGIPSVVLVLVAAGLLIPHWIGNHRYKDVAASVDALVQQARKSNGDRDFAAAKDSLQRAKAQIESVSAARAHTLIALVEETHKETVEAERDYKDKLSRGWRVFEGRFVSKEEEASILQGRRLAQEQQGRGPAFDRLKQFRQLLRCYTERANEFNDKRTVQIYCKGDGTEYAFKEDNGTIYRRENNVEGSPWQPVTLEDAPCGFQERRKGTGKAHRVMVSIRLDLRSMMPSFSVYSPTGTPGEDYVRHAKGAKSDADNIASRQEDGEVAYIEEHIRGSAVFREDDVKFYGKGINVGVCVYAYTGPDKLLKLLDGP